MLRPQLHGPPPCLSCFVCLFHVRVEMKRSTVSRFLLIICLGQFSSLRAFHERAKKDRLTRVHTAERDTHTTCIDIRQCDDVTTTNSMPHRDSPMKLLHIRLSTLQPQPHGKKETCRLRTQEPNHNLSAARREPDRRKEVSKNGGSSVATRSANEQANS